MSRAEDFWSRRKARVREEEAEQARAVEARERAEHERALEARTDDEILQELGLPDPDTMEPGDDFGAFMARAVPERLRRRALRRLWRSNSALANLDGLLEYGEDYTNSATVVENLQTVYKVGQGMAARIKELASEDAPDTEPVEDVVQSAAPAPEPTETQAEPQEPPQIVDDTPAEAVTGAEPAEEEAFAAALPPRRRMQFHFQDQPQDRAGGQA